MKRKLETKKVLLSELKEFPGNPNVHPEEQVKAIAESMERYGQYYPIIVDEKHDGSLRTWQEKGFGISWRERGFYYGHVWFD